MIVLVRAIYIIIVNCNREKMMEQKNGKTTHLDLIKTPLSETRPCE